MKWTEKQLSELCDSIVDCRHKTAPESECITPYKMLRTSNIRNGAIDYDDVKYVNEKTYMCWNEGRELKIGDVIFTREAPLGEAAYVTQDDNYFLGQRLVRLRANPDVCNSRFLAYLFQVPKYKKAIIASGSGSTVVHMRVPEVNKITFRVPDLPTQHRIASILSAYDDLIENNRRQIKLLEEAAQRLYREWFVELRFPGCEDVKIVDGVPEGWKYGCIKEIVQYYDTIRKPLSSRERASFQGKYRYYGAAGILDYVAEFLYDGTYLLFGEDGSVITADGYPILQYVSGQFWVNNHAHVLQGKPPFSTEYIYMMFQHTKVSDVVTGVAQPKISQNRLSNKKVLIPHKKYVTMYCTHIESYFQRTLLLKNQIDVTQEARDRLLPKLMSGEMEVNYETESI